MEIRERLLTIRKSRNLNQEDFGKRIGVTRSAVCNYENGTRPISDQVILAVCREFGVSETWMRYEVGSMNIPPKDGVIDQLIAEYECSKFEGDFLKAYFQMTEDERSNFVHGMYRLFAPLMDGMKGSNPFAGYFDVTYGVDSPEAIKAAEPPKVETQATRTQEAEALYEKNLGFVPSIDSSASSITEDMGSIG